jgi:hypothetical protein
MIKLLYSSVVIRLRLLEILFVLCLVQIRRLSLRSIWGCHQLWVEQNGGLSMKLKIEFWRRLQGWKEKLLSQAGREVLIKAVIQAIPTYAMSCFKFLASFCAELSAMATRFWWRQRGVERKIHWLNKTKLMKSKNEGGMGFRTYNFSTKLYWLVKVGGCFINHHLYFVGYLRLSIFPTNHS